MGKKHAALFCFLIIIDNSNAFLRDPCALCRAVIHILQVYNSCVQRYYPP